MEDWPLDDLDSYILLRQELDADPDIDRVRRMYSVCDVPELVWMTAWADHRQHSNDVHFWWPPVLALCYGYKLKNMIGNEYRIDVLSVRYRLPWTANHCILYHSLRLVTICLHCSAVPGQQLGHTLAWLIARSQTLKTLQLRHCDLDADDRWLILEALPASTSLEWLWLPDIWSDAELGFIHTHFPLGAKLEFGIADLGLPRPLQNIPPPLGFWQPSLHPRFPRHVSLYDVLLCANRVQPTLPPELWTTIFAFLHVSDFFNILPPAPLLRPQHQRAITDYFLPVAKRRKVYF